MNKGILYAIIAYGAWGFLPIYWKWLQSVPALQIMTHRVIWSLVFLAILITLRKEWEAFRTQVNGRVILIYTAAGCLLGVNWLTYIWGVNAGFIVETSLGYYINPLVSVVLGVIFLRERLTALQWMPVGLAALGVIYLTLSYGALPWIALVLASSFSLYGLIKKVAPLGPLYGLSLETFALFVPALLYLLWVERAGTGVFGHAGGMNTLLLVLTGVVTATPLLVFTAAARRIPLYQVGILQYIAPTIQLLIGVLVYGEPFNQTRIIGFGTIWLALIIYTAGSMWEKRRSLASEAR